MIIDFYGHAKKAIKDDVEAALWFAKDELMPRHRKLSITVHFIKDLRKKYFLLLPRVTYKSYRTSALFIGVQFKPLSIIRNF